jgi:hypothetical protein
MSGSEKVQLGRPSSIPGQLPTPASGSFLYPRTHDQKVGRITPHESGEERVAIALGLVGLGVGLAVEAPGFFRETVGRGLRAALELVATERRHEVGTAAAHLTLVDVAPEPLDAAQQPLTGSFNLRNRHRY